MSFEQPELPKDELATQEIIAEGSPQTYETNETNEIEEIKRVESMFGKTLKCFKRWGNLGIVVGGVFAAGEVIREQNAKQGEYDAYINSSLSAEQMHMKSAAEAQIQSIFGEYAVVAIHAGDIEAYFERKQNMRVEPEVSGFSENGWTNYHKYVLTEKYRVYPKGWLAGEVAQIKFNNSLESMGENIIRGGQFSQSFFSSPVINIYRSYSKTDSVDQVAPISEIAISHELGHANDWRTDMDLNILERQELLLKVHERLTAPDSWHRGGDDHYHETFVDGSKDGLYKAAQEYWAEICAAYFEDPKDLLEHHPKDFELVDTYAKKNDSTFDVFSEDRGAFDTTTGRLKEVWKDK